MALVPCDSCRRHVRAGDAACPFCKAVRTATTVAVTAVAAFTIAGCDTFSPASKYGGPPEGYTPPSATTPVTTEAPDAAAPVAEPTPTPTTSPRLDPPPAPSPSPAPTTRPTGGAPAAMYGAPPGRR